MSNDLLKQLEDKINEAIDTIELSRMEITELKEQKDELENRYADWEGKLSALIEKFEQLEDGSNSENKKNLEETIQEVELDDNESVKAEDIELKEDNLGDEEADIDSVENSDKLEASADDEDDEDDEDDDAKEFHAQDSSEEVVAEIDETEGSVFGPNTDSYTESPGSTQHYA